ncbi:MAG: hypothetical protein P1V21_00225 [Rhizobiaceae bacterium]|nr:hypothetical protein [Rhizobiaceae bacterium]
MGGWNDETYDRILRQIYESASTPELWSPTLDTIAEFLDVGFMHLLFAHPETNFEYIEVAPREDPDFNAEYLRDFVDLDFRLERFKKQPIGVAFDERQISSPEERKRSPIYQELYPRHNVHQLLMANMSIDESRAGVSVTTRNWADEFSDGQRQAFQRLLPHILQSMRITKQNMDLQFSRFLAFEALDGVNSAIFLFFHQQLVQVNNTGKQLLDEGFFLIRNGQIALSNAAADRELQTWLQQANPFSCPPLLLRDDADRAEYLIRLHDPKPHFSRGRLQKSGSHIVSITRIRSTRSLLLRDVEQFSHTYGLSAAEMRVLHAVLNHGSLSDLAQSNGVKTDTVRKQLKSTMSKMDVKSQKMLFQLFERYNILGP